MKTLLVLLGPTGVGKTDLSIGIAKAFGTEIISCDSRQIYKEMRIGTAVPSSGQLAAVRHHFIQMISVHDYYNSWQFEVQALERIRELFQEKEVVLMTGGSMLYIDAVCKGIDDIPTISPELRTGLMEVYEREGLESIRQMLKELDPVFYGQVDRRVDLMLEEGLEDEARRLWPLRHLNALNTVGYKELFDYFEGKTDYAEAVRLIKRNSRRYARKQLSWFRRDDDIRWFHPDDYEGIVEAIRLMKIG